LQLQLVVRLPSGSRQARQHAVLACWPVLAWHGQLATGSHHDTELCCPLRCSAPHWPCPALPCPAGFCDVGGQCVTDTTLLGTDKHCSACGDACSSGSECVGKKCTPKCPEGGWCGVWDVRRGVGVGWGVGHALFVYMRACIQYPAVGCGEWITQVTALKSITAYCQLDFVFSAAHAIPTMHLS